MAITDKVIELTPVNKKKNIIFYIIMGVLLATTVLFLVLYLIKPNASTGEVSGISVMWTTTEPLLPSKVRNT